MTRLLAATAAAVALTGAALAATHEAGRPQISAAGARPAGPYFVCAAYGDFGVCIGPPTN